MERLEPALIRAAMRALRRGYEKEFLNLISGAGRARTYDDRIMSSEAMTGSNTVERG